MRMRLYEIDIKRGGGSVKGHIVAADEPRAAELVFEHDDILSQESARFTLRRVDDDLPPEWCRGLDDMLESAPEGLASYFEPVGWIVHVTALQKLRLFRIEDQRGAETYVIAPGSDVASTLYVTSNPVSEGEHMLYRISDGLANLPPERIANLNELLEFGPIGIVAFHHEDGWSLVI